MSFGELISVTLPDGEVLYVELDTPAEGDVAWRNRRVAWEEIRDQVTKVGKWVVESVRSGLPDSPTRVGVEFGIKLLAETGTLVGALAKASGEATIVVRLEWDRTNTPQTERPANH